MERTSASFNRTGHFRTRTRLFDLSIFQAWIFGAFVIAVSLIVIDVTAGGAPELCEEIVAAAMVHTNISDSVVAN